MQLAEEKAALRAEALARRDALAPDYREAAARRITDTVLALRHRFPAGPVSAFWPIRSEIDTRPLMEFLARTGAVIALPIVEKPRLTFRRWRPGETLRSAGFGLSEPHDHAPALVPATMLVPLAAFDRCCHRIGYGAGFYDRAIAEISAIAVPLTIGLAFAVQEVARVPADWHDRALDLVVTEDGVIKRAGGV
jgi:5-formyltetrahydrofolate cyclo-ligase